MKSVSRRSWRAENLCFASTLRLWSAAARGFDQPNGEGVGEQVDVEGIGWRVGFQIGLHGPADGFDPRVAQLKDRRQLRLAVAAAEIFRDLMEQRWREAESQDGAIRIVFPRAIHSGRNHIDIAGLLHTAHAPASAMTFGIDRRAEMHPQAVHLAPRYPRQPARNAQEIRGQCAPAAAGACLENSHFNGDTTPASP